jgi:purine catabolism regulator
VEVGAAVPRQTMARLADEMLRAVSAPGTHATAGISRPHAGPDSFRLTHDDAIHALELGRGVDPSRQVVHFDDLGIYRLLLSGPKDELSAFHDETLGRLATYDREKGSALLPTLDAYLRAHNAAEAAQRLSLHRNTLLYRLRRIREITGADLDDPETRLALHLALRAGEALRARRHADEP